MEKINKCLTKFKNWYKKSVFYRNSTQIIFSIVISITLLVFVKLIFELY